MHIEWKAWRQYGTAPYMYIGDTGISGLHHLFKEIIDNSIGEVLAGHCDQIKSDPALKGPLTITVEDNGRGIPVDINTQTGMTGRRDGNDRAPRRRQIQQPVAAYKDIRRPARRRRLLHVRCPLSGSWLETTVPPNATARSTRMRFERGVVGQADLESSGTRGPE